MSCDFRYQKDALKGLNYAICGLGNSLYEENFNKVAIQIDKSFSSLQANRIAPLYCCDENTVKSKHASLEGDVAFWQNNFFEKLSHYVKSRQLSSEPSSAQGCCQSKSGVQENNGSCCQNNGESAGSCCQNGDEHEDDEEEVDGSTTKYEDTTDEEGAGDEENGEEGSFFSDIDDDLVDDENQRVKIQKQPNGLVDLEDLGKVMNGMKNKNKLKNGEPKEMITPLLRKSLEKQGYKLIGSHSGVKLCRWTKSMLRGIA
jgi:tRNA wybutosine-synthesizing protein 1